MNEQAKTKDFTDEEMEAKLRSLDRRSATEATVHLICSMLSRKGNELDSGQKMDLVTAMIDVHRTATISEFLRVITQGLGGEEYGLMKPGDDAEKEKHLRKNIAFAILTAERRVPHFSQRLMLLAEALFPAKAEAGA
jgi:hypothetical protein